MSTPRDYTLAEQQAGLIALAAHAGQAGPASRALKGQGVDIGESTLRSWKDSKRKEYDELRERYGRHLEQEIVRSMREAVAYTQGVILKAVVAAEKRLDDGRDIDPSKTAAALSRVVGTEADKLLAFTGRPINPTSDRSPDQIIAALKARGLLGAGPTPADAEAEVAA